ncbi:MAG TPA: Stp1/IreP family PP2C-type Ser/Thr phosphatase [Solirubrobacteraceae bacterium]|nr:Stp1/IreP family PP2C-type Ser/Thr phosphatase [Solirubrobacteraceae bacterium]
MTLRAADTANRTDTGRQRRGNEDSSLARAPLFVIADGMGGAQAGEVASQLAVEAFADALPDTGTPEERLAQRAQDANRRIYEMSRSAHERAGMGTTLTAVYVDTNELAVAHVGDSRAYLYRHGELGRLTQDHTLVEELLRRGKLTEEQAAEHPQRSIITRALGVDPVVEVDTRSYAGRDGDVILMCSDGLTSMISEKEILTILDRERDLDRAAEQLIDAANEAGGRDNITVILFRLEDVGGDTDHPTMTGVPAVGPDADAGAGAAPGVVDTPANDAGASTGAAGAPAHDPANRSGPASTGTLTEPRATTHSTPRTRSAGRSAERSPQLPTSRRRGGRFARPLAALITVIIVLALVGGGGYLATRQLFFLGTNAQGIVTVYRGLPYDLPLGIRLYETVYVSGVPATSIPAARRAKLFDHQLRSQNDAISLVHAAELGQLTP